MDQPNPGSSQVPESEDQPKKDLITDGGRSKLKKRWYILPTLFIALFAVIGITYRLTSSAATATVVKTGFVSLGLVNSGGHTMCLDDYGDKAVNGTRVVIWTCNTADPAQKWSLYSDNTIRILGKCLDVYQASKTAGAEIDLYACNGGTNQVWTTGANPKVSLNDLVSKQTGYCLDDWGSQTANANHTDLYPCNGSAAQVWGWNTGSSVTAGGATANANCTLIAGFGEPGACYVQMGGIQSNTGNALGASANFAQYAPYCGPNCGHSAVEFYVGSADEKEAVEFGWGVPANSPKGTAAKLSIGLWANGAVVDANSNFVPVSKTVKIGQAVATNGTAANYKIQYVSASQEWQLFYNNAEVGYFPESVWTSRKTTLTSMPLALIFGEVVFTPALLNSNMQMGNGVLGGKSGAASVTGYTLYGTSTAPKLTALVNLKNTAYYAEGSLTGTSFTYGGPGVQ
jgi:hypothetical protein